MIYDIVILLFGFILLIKGADIFVDGACSIAYKLKVPAIVVGLTIVAIGTSCPEAAVSISAALQHSNAIAVSNVVGSNIFNILMVLGVTSLIKTLPVTKSVIKKDFPFLLIISIVCLLMSAFDYQYSRIDGIILLIGIVGYITWLIINNMDKATTSEPVESKFSLPVASIIIILGIAGIVIGGDLVVKGAKGIAEIMGMSEKLIGLTIVSIGTSLPELVTGLVAAKKGEVDIAIGNVVGSNIFNILFILGSSSAIMPITIEPVLLIDLTIMVIITLIAYITIRINKKINWQIGIFYLALFVSYMTYIIIRN